MATEEHKRLANIVKCTHATLREEAQNYGPDVAWQRHLARKELLQKYATSMQKLATTYWAENNSAAKRATYCRMEWIRCQCKEYFFNGGIEKYDQREEDIELKITGNQLPSKDDIHNDHAYLSTEVYGLRNYTDAVRKLSARKRIKLLDVGSCYNPFATEETFDVTAIDLTAVPGKVFQCDFLNVDIGEKKVLSSNNQEILQLPESSFDVVVFSLFLEYLPCPEQRYLCCRKAYKLLEKRGILIVVTPDSKHVSANARIMKSWRYVLSELGFMRIKYEKLRHIHCLVFRKCALKHIATRWADLQVLPDNEPLYRTNNRIFIPQDFRNTLSESEKQQEEEKYSAEELVSVFNELPFDST